MPPARRATAIYCIKPRAVDAYCAGSRHARFFLRNAIRFHYTPGFVFMYILCQPRFSFATYERMKRVWRKIFP